MDQDQKQVPKYLQLKQEILSWLHSGQLLPDERMPSEHEVAGRYGMSRQTVRQTFGELEKEGWLYRVQGKGTFVSAPKPKATQDIQNVGMMTTYISDYIFPHIVRGVEASLRAGGYSLMLSSTDNDKEKERESLAMMLGQPLAGLIIEPTKSAQGNPNLSYYLSLFVRRIPFVMINERYPEIDCPCVKVDDEAGGFAATEHLFKLGHRQIAGFFKTDDLQGANRLRGFVRAHRRYDCPLLPDRAVVYATEEKAAKPLEAALALLGRADRPTAFVCYNDELAVKLIDAARQAGFSVPGDLSVVGFDDSALATAGEVKLTTVAHPKTEMGTKAAELLLHMIEHPSSATPADIVYEPRLIIRDSTAGILS
ncbi:GntR family transcriptional regulator [Paenibacillus hodogayensis]|uniref:GntR family transcriptional regulator n=1 Tax=Paenibacillus hodogayensis TaxID=279208 RepID=A0ABV5W1G9_9BACL